jgi:hypothetical protein
MPPTSVAITIAPKLIASKIVFGNPSVKEGDINTLL